ncbi:MAG: hypothetical protein M3P82_03310 [Bacteroidota bacterium]|nr:hypothetical protein [Bacteroidota bacterium]
MDLKKPTAKKINPFNGKEIDEMFDGHLEKPLSDMTPKEKLDYLWLQMKFKWQIRNRVIIEKKTSIKK